MINYSETAVGSPCYVKINFLQWKPEIYKTIIEELTLKCEDHCVEGSDTSAWYIAPKDGGIYTKEFAERIDALWRRFAELKIEAPFHTYAKSSWEDIEDEKARKNIKKYYM